MISYNDLQLISESNTVGGQVTVLSESHVRLLNNLLNRIKYSRSLCHLSLAHCLGTQISAVVSFKVHIKCLGAFYFYEQSDEVAELFGELLLTIYRKCDFEGITNTILARETIAESIKPLVADFNVKLKTVHGVADSKWALSELQLMLEYIANSRRILKEQIAKKRSATAIEKTKEALINEINEANNYLKYIQDNYITILD